MFNNKSGSQFLYIICHRVLMDIISNLFISWRIYLSALFIYLSIYISIHLSVLSIYLSIYLSVLSILLSSYLSITGDMVSTGDCAGWFEHRDPGAGHREQGDLPPQVVHHAHTRTFLLRGHR